MCSSPHCPAFHPLFVHTHRGISLRVCVCECVCLAYKPQLGLGAGPAVCSSIFNSSVVHRKMWCVWSQLTGNTSLLGWDQRFFWYSHLIHTDPKELGCLQQQGRRVCFNLCYTCKPTAAFAPLSGITDCVIIVWLQWLWCSIRCGVTGHVTPFGEIWSYKNVLIDSSVQGVSKKADYVCSLNIHLIW